MVALGYNMNCRELSMNYQKLCRRCCVGLSFMVNYLPLVSGSTISFLGTHVKTIIPNNRIREQENSEILKIRDINIRSKFYSMTYNLKRKTYPWIGLSFRGVSMTYSHKLLEDMNSSSSKVP